MVQLNLISDTGATLCRLTLDPSATVAQLLQQVFLVKPELRAGTRAIRNEARGTVYVLENVSSGGPAQTLQEARLTSLNAAQETLVLSSNTQSSAARGASSAPAVSNPHSSSTSTASVPTQSDAAARMLALFGGHPAAASASHVAPLSQAHQQQPPPPSAGSAEAFIDPALLDPAQAEMQRRLYEYIQQQQIDENLANALEYTPEAFARVIMLYVPCTINQIPVNAFVDSGAQMSIMNRATAERCGLMRLVDKRMRGVAVGVGRQEILGRIHMTPVNLSGMHIPFSFSVIAEQEMDLIIGLDQLKRHQMIIDLQHNCLTIDTVQVPFLSEGEIPQRGDIDVEEEGVEGGEVAVSGGGAEEDAPRAAQLPPTPPPPASPASPAAAMPSTTPAAASATSDDATIAAVRRGLQVESFMEFTGLLDREQAAALLEAANWDPDVAGVMYFDA